MVASPSTVPASLPVSPDPEQLLQAAVRERDPAAADRLLRQWVHRRGLAALDEFLVRLAISQGEEARQWLSERIQAPAASISVVTPPLGGSPPAAASAAPPTSSPVPASAAPETAAPATAEPATALPPRSFSPIEPTKPAANEVPAAIDEPAAIEQPMQVEAPEQSAIPAPEPSGQEQVPAAAPPAVTPAASAAAPLDPALAAAGTAPDPAAEPASPGPGADGVEGPLAWNFDFDAAFPPLGGGTAPVAADAGDEPDSGREESARLPRRGPLARMRSLVRDYLGEARQALRGDHEQEGGVEPERQHGVEEPAGDSPAAPAPEEPIWTPPSQELPGRPTATGLPQLPEIDAPAPTAPALSDLRSWLPGGEDELPRAS